MPKRKQKQNQKASDDEIESEKPAKQFKKQNTSRIEFIAKNIASTSKTEYNCGEDSHIENVGESCESAINGTQYENFSTFLNAFSYYFDEEDNERQKPKSTPQNTSNKNDVSINKSQKSLGEASHLASTFIEDTVNEDFVENIRVISAPSVSSEIVLLEHPASLTLHGYVNVTPWCGNVQIFGFNVKEGETVAVFSTEGTGLKQLVTLRPKHRLDIEVLRKKLEILTYLEKIDLDEFLDEVTPSSVIVCLKQLLLPAPLQFLELYYPAAVQAKWVRSETSEKEKYFKLCSTEQAYTIDIHRDFKMLLRQINEVISNADESEFGPRILIRGDKNMGKSTLMRYLLNSSLNKFKEVYFLDTDPGQTEYTPPGVVSLLRVTKPLLGPPFAHQKRPLKMIFIGSVTPGTSPKLYEASVKSLMGFFNNRFPKKTLFVNTIGWVQGMGELCVKGVRNAVKPTVEIELVAPDPDLSLTREVDENKVTVFKVPSKAPPREKGAPSYSPVELRNFNITAYFGQCQRTYLPLTQINAFHPVCVPWDKIVLYVMGKKVPPHRLVEAIHCSIVALCHVDLSCVLKSDNPDFPMTLKDEYACECLGYGLVRASDETNRLFYIVTPLQLDELKKVNALIKGNIMIPDEIILKQTVKGIPLPFTNHSQVAKTPGLKAVPKRAFRNTQTPNKTQ